MGFASTRERRQLERRVIGLRSVRFSQDEGFERLKVTSLTNSAQKLPVEKSKSPVLLLLLQALFWNDRCPKVAVRERVRSLCFVPLESSGLLNSQLCPELELHIFDAPERRPKSHQTLADLASECLEPLGMFHVAWRFGAWVRGIPAGVAAKMWPAGPGNAGRSLLFATGLCPGRAAVSAFNGFGGLKKEPVHGLSDALSMWERGRGRIAGTLDTWPTWDQDDG